MPFRKVGSDDYVTPKGNHFNSAQVRLWHANGGKFPGQKGPGEMQYAKGGMVKSCAYAQGGAVLGRTRSFMKEPDYFRGEAKCPQDYAGQSPEPKGKEMAPVKPKK